MTLTKLWNSKIFRLTGGVVFFLLAFGIAYLMMMDKDADVSRVHSVTPTSQGCEVTLKLGYEYVTFDEESAQVCSQLKPGDVIQL